MAAKIETVPDDQIEQVKLNCALCGVFVHALAAPKGDRVLTAEQWLALAQGSVAHGQEKDHEGELAGLAA